MQNYQPILSKDSIEKSIKNRYWKIPEVSIALQEKKYSRLKKNSKTHTHFAVLTEKNLAGYLENLNHHLMKEEQYPFRMQIAIYKDDTHWFALDLEIQHDKVSAFLLDSVPTQESQKFIIEILSKTFSMQDSTLYALDLGYSNTLQRDGTTCSIFTLHNIFSLPKAITLHEELSKLPLKKSYYGAYVIGCFDVFPESLVNILKPIQTLSLLKNLPEKLLNLPIRKTKQLKERNDLPLTLNSIFTINIRDTKDSGEKQHNYYIHEKKNKTQRKN